MKKYTYIYALLDPITNEIRYIGKSNNPKKRINNHIYESKKLTTHKANWIKSLIKKNLKPKIKIIEKVLYNEWEKKEKYYILKYKNLTNFLKGGNPGPCLFGKNNPSHKRKNKKRSEFFSKEIDEKIKKATSKAVSGKNNKHAKKWKIISPENKIYFIEGCLVSFCKNYNLSFSSIYSFKNKGKIPNINNKSRNFGQKRLNSIGWEIIQLN